MDRNLVFRVAALLHESCVDDQVNLTTRFGEKD